jgi:hypothetical protein
VFSFSAVFDCHWCIIRGNKKGGGLFFYSILHGVNEYVCICMDGIVVLHVSMGAGGYLTEHT